MDDINSLRAAISAVANWDALLEAAEFHGLLPLLSAAIEGAGPDVSPPLDVAQRLRAAYRDSAKRAMFFSGRLAALLDVLQGQGVPALPLKGPVLAESLYQDPALRPVSDLDLLIHRRDVPAVLRLLVREGYVRGEHMAWLPVETLVTLNSEVTLRHPLGVHVDLQWAIAQGDYPFCFDPEILWRSLRPVRLAGREVPNLTLESLLLFLCVHGAKHLWSRLMWLGDVARLTRRDPDWVLALQLATDAECVRPWLLALLLASDLLEAAVPPWVLERARAEPAVEAAAREVKARLDHMPPVEPGSLALTAFNGKLASRRWDKVRHYAALLHAPTEAELELLRLPRKLFVLYYPVRAARLTAKYVLRLK